MRVKELAAWLKADWEGDGERELRRVASLEDAGPDDLSFATHGRAAKYAGESKAGCLLVPADYSNGTQRTIIRTADPRSAIARVIPKLHPRTEPAAGVHPTAVVGPGTVIGFGVYVGPLVTIGAGVHLGAGTSVGPGSVIGDYVRIGDGCVLHARVTVYHDVKIGNHVTLHSGCVIGAEGFGYVLHEGIYEKFPQVGRVELETASKLALIPAWIARPLE